MTRVTRSALALLIFAFLSGCGEFVQSMEDLWDLQSEISAHFELDDVHVHLQNNEVLTVTVTDAPANDFPAEPQIDWALEFARYAFTAYGPDKGLKTLVVEFADEPEGDSEDGAVTASYRFATASLLPATS